MGNLQFTMACVRTDNLMWCCWGCCAARAACQIELLLGGARVIFIIETLFKRTDTTATRDS
jgi:hypothetical protein